MAAGRLPAPAPVDGVGVGICEVVEAATAGGSAVVLGFGVVAGVMAGAGAVLVLVPVAAPVSAELGTGATRAEVADDVAAGPGFDGEPTDGPTVGRIGTAGAAVEGPPPWVAPGAPAAGGLPLAGVIAARTATLDAAPCWVTPVTPVAGDPWAAAADRRAAVDAAVGAPADASILLFTSTHSFRRLSWRRSWPSEGATSLISTSAELSGTFAFVGCCNFRKF